MSSLIASAKDAPRVPTVVISIIMEDKANVMNRRRKKRDVRKRGRCLNVTRETRLFLHEWRLDQARNTTETGRFRTVVDLPKRSSIAKRSET